MIRACLPSEAGAAFLNQVFGRARRVRAGRALRAARPEPARLRQEAFAATGSLGHPVTIPSRGRQQQRSIP
jgi:hypothetical protein